MIYLIEFLSSDYNINKHFLLSLKVCLISFISFFNINNLFKYIKIVEINNEMKNLIYENNTEFKIINKTKIFSIYYPENTYLQLFLNSYNNSNQVNTIYNNLFFIRRKEKLRKRNSKELNDLLNSQIKLAKMHGITGFGIIHYYFGKNFIINEVTDIFEKIREDSFKFFFIFKKTNYSEIKVNNQLDNIITPLNNNFDSFKKYLMLIKKYLQSNCYINIDNKPLVGFWHPVNLEFILDLRRFVNKTDIGNLYIIEITDRNEILDAKILFDGISVFNKFPSKSLFIDETLKDIYYFNYYYDLIQNKNFSDLEIHNLNILEGTSPEKFFLICKYIFNLVRNKKKNNFILINAWNNVNEKYSIEFSEKYGYSYLNSLSKALLNLSFSSKKYYLHDLNNKSKIAIQAHIYYEYLIFDIINKINNMPVKFDLFISTTSIDMKDKIIKCINNSKLNLNYLEVDIYQNKGRDVLPFLIQLKKKIKNYKYICHLHTKRSSINPNIGISWRNYLYNNLLGNQNIIKEILWNFENQKKIGIIFPETYYLIYNF